MASPEFRVWILFLLTFVSSVLYQIFYSQFTTIMYYTIEVGLHTGLVKTLFLYLNHATSKI